MTHSSVWYFGIGFAIGGFVRDIVRMVWHRYCIRKFERDFKLAETRMKGCAHAHTTLTDTGMGLNTPKCLDCWALRFDNDDGHWFANCASPKNAHRLTRELQESRKVRK
jgi:hypothetical protein